MVIDSERGERERKIFSHSLSQNQKISIQNNFLSVACVTLTRPQLSSGLLFFNSFIYFFGVIQLKKYCSNGISSISLECVLLKNILYRNKQKKYNNHNEQNLLDIVRRYACEFV